MKVRVYNDEPLRALTKEEIVDALTSLDSSCPREEWIKIGMAFKDAGEDLFEEWAQWSVGGEQGAGGEECNDKDALAAWKNFKPGKSTHGPLLFLANKNGWIDPRRQERSAERPTEQQTLLPAVPLDEDAKRKRNEVRNKFAAYMEKNGYKIAAIYRYSDSYFVYRLEHPTEKKLFSQISFDGKAWTAKAPEGLRPLFNLASLQEADPQEQVFVFEGEKCTIAAEGLGLLATTSSEGSESSASTDWTPLRGRSVVIVPDRDIEGEKYALAVEKILRGLECEIRIVRLNFELKLTQYDPDWPYGFQEELPPVYEEIKELKIKKQIEDETRKLHNSCDEKQIWNDYSEVEKNTYCNQHISVQNDCLNHPTWCSIPNQTPAGFDLFDLIENRKKIDGSNIQNMVDRFKEIPDFPLKALVRLSTRIERDVLGILRRYVLNARVLSRREGSSLLDDLVGFEEGLAATHGKKFIGLSCGFFRKLDKMLDGWRGFGILAAEPGVGKTTLLLQVGLGIVATNPNACFVFFSFDMPRAPILRRLAAQATRISTHLLQKGDQTFYDVYNPLNLSPEDQARLADRMKALRALAPRICIVEMEDLGQVRGLSHEEIQDAMIQKVELFKTHSKCANAFVLVDDLSKVPIARDSTVSSLELDEARVSLLLEIQRRVDDPLVVISQMNDNAVDKPGMSSSKIPAEIACSPDFLITLSTKKDSEIEAEPLSFVKKYREGKSKRTFFSANIVKGRDDINRGIVQMIFNIENHFIEEMQD